MRKSGIDIVGNIPWGTHLCQFYRTRQDLCDILVPYFKAGLEHNEFCIWVTASPLTGGQAERELRKAVPKLDRYLRLGQMEIIPHTQWYLEKGKFSFPRVMDGWVSKLNLALNRGFEGLRVTGNTAWLLQKDWKNFIEYEEEINRVIGDLKMIAVCSYNLGKCGASEVIEVVNHHQFVCIRRDGKWNLIENVQQHLANQTMRASKEQLALVVDASMDAIIAVNEAGNISLFNPAAEELFQFGVDEVLQQPVRVLLREDASELHHKRLERFLRKGIGRCGHIGRRTEFTFRRKDGTPFDGELSMSGARVGGKRMIVVSIRDITERKRAEEALRESEGIFKNFMEHSPIYIFFKDENIRALRLSRNFETMLGRPIAELLGKNMEDLFPSELAKSMVADDIRILKEGKEVTAEEELNGRFYSTTKFPIQIEGKPRYLGGYTMDITERKRAEDSLRQSQQKYKTILDTSIDGFWITDLQGYIQEANDACFHLLGYSRDELLKMNISDIESKEKPEETAARIRKIVKRGWDRFETKQRRKDGEILDIEVSVNFMDIGGGRLFVFHRDITERRKMQEMIRRAASEWRTTLDAMPELVMLLDSKNKILRVNKSVCKMLNLTFREIIGQPCYRLIHGTEAPPEHCPHQKAVTGKTECFSNFFEKNLNRHFDAGSIPLLDDDKNVVSIVHVLRDITEELKLQKKLRNVEKMAVIGEIAGIIAHEIKNPLFAITSGIEILQDHLKLGGAQKETLEIILRETVRMDYLVRQLLDYGRHRALNELAFAPVDMREVIDEVVALNSGLLQVQGIRAEMKMPTNLPSVMAEKSEMIQVFINLLQNAIEVSRKGDVIEIEARADDNRKMLIISMKDRGPGILKEMKEKIFEIFFTTKKGSYGMGLVISKRIILDHGGDIRVESEPGKGANFIVELPIK
jgi:PAS domain S-box-containing protein